MTISSFTKILTHEDPSLPMYQKIKEHILEKIAKDEWKAHQKLPSENEISAELNISRMTVNRAFKELTEEGYLFREKGAGTFVAEPFQLIPFFELNPISQEIAIEGNVYTSQIIAQTALQSTQNIDIDALNELKEQALFYSEICYFSNHIPIQYEKRYVSTDFAPQYLSETFLIDCSTTYLQKISPILSQKHVLEAIIPNDDLCQILKIAQGEACFKITEKLLVQHQLVSIAEQYYPASRYKFHSKV